MGAASCTANAFEIAWRPDGGRFAMTEYVGNNAADVHVFTTASTRAKIDLSGIIRERFPSNAWEISWFMKSFRWTAEGKLVVRAIARSSAAPYELFGCEALVDTSIADAPLITFLRGYIKE